MHSVSCELSLIVSQFDINLSLSLSLSLISWLWIQIMAKKIWNKRAGGGWDGKEGDEKAQEGRKIRGYNMEQRIAMTSIYAMTWIADMTSIPAMT